MFPRLVETRRDIHRHPELGSQEVRTTRLVTERLKALGLEIKTPASGCGVVALLRGAREGGIVAVRADMAALPIQEARETPYRSTVPNVMHACGHDVHVAAALGVAELLAKHRDQVAGTVKFIFQPAEEGMGADFVGDWGAARMVREGALENPRPDAIFGLDLDPNKLITGRSAALTDYGCTVCHRQCPGGAFGSWKPMRHARRGERGEAR